MLQQLSILPSIGYQYTCPQCSQKITTYHEHDPIEIEQIIEGDSTSIRVHFDMQGNARAIWKIIKLGEYDWDTVTLNLNRTIGYPPKIEVGSCIHVHSLQKATWWRARRHRLTFDYIIRFEGMKGNGWVYSYHIYASTTGDNVYEPDYHYIEETAVEDEEMEG